MKKLSLILLSFIPAVPAGFLVYLMIRAMTLKHVWDKTALWVIICLTVVIAALVAIVPPLYAIAFYTGQPKTDEDVPGEEGNVAEAAEEAESDEGEAAETEAEAEAEEFPEEDLDAFEGEEVADAEEMADDFEPADTGSEFDLDEDGVAQSDTDDFDLGSADDFEEIEELEEEAPKPKKKKKK